MILPDFNFEKSLIPTGCRFILGIDEVGRSPWAGPVTIGAFLLDIKNFDYNFFVKNKIRDSKLLSASQRQSIYLEIQKQPFTFKTFSSTSSEIDRQGIAVVLKNLIAQALESFDYDFAIVDGNYNLKPCRGTSLIKADQQCFSVASASICAKVVRDATMDEFDTIYPVYGFKNHKGYGTKQHLEALKTHGPCPIHRQSFRPLKNLFTFYSI